MRDGLCTNCNKGRIKPEAFAIFPDDGRDDCISSLFVSIGYKAVCPECGHKYGAAVRIPVDHPCGVFYETVSDGRVIA